MVPMTSTEPRPAREPIFNLPASVLAVIAALVGIHALRSWVFSEIDDFRLLIDWAVVPARWAVAYGGASVDAVLSAIGQAGEGTQTLEAGLARYVLSQESGRPLTGLTYALLHGSWAHVMLNSVWLAAFGTPVARRCGPWRFLALAAATAFGGAVAHVLVHPYQALPMIGASAAVSGMMAAAAWFIFSRPTWLLEGRVTEPHERQRESLLGLARNRRAVIFFAVWLATNYLSAVLAGPLGITDASIAWEAHLGGFVAGLLLFPLVDPLNPRTLRAAA
jgi:membrane associated rhomboid family serine protease